MSTREWPADATSDVDLVFDLVGGELLGKSWSVMRPGGRIVSVVEDPAARPEAREDSQSVFFVVEFSGEKLGELASQIGSGMLRPVVGDVCGLADGREAFTTKQAGGLRGKSVLEV